jgi:hypothetical protein
MDNSKMAGWMLGGPKSWRPVSARLSEQAFKWVDSTGNE